MTPRLFALGLALALLAVGPATAASPSAASARAFAIKVVVPGQAGAATASVAAPPDAAASGRSFAYPADGSVVASGGVTSSASATSASRAASAGASSAIADLVLFGGEVTAAQLTGRATASARRGRAPTGDLTRSSISGLVVLGQAVDAVPGARVALGDWGYAIVLAQGAAPASDGFRGFVTALAVHVTVDHGGLPAGSQILVGYAEAAAQAAPAPATTRTTPAPPTTKRPPPAATTPPAAATTAPAATSASPPATTSSATTTGEPKTRKPAPRKAARRQGAAAEPKPGRRAIPPIVRRPLPSVPPKLTEGGYVFPVHGAASFTDTFGAARAVVGWHHGEDVFAAIGAPVLAVAKGTVFSVGWNDVGGNRLWLRDTKGNEFYYAHLSAFSPLAVNGAHVQAGDVLGFVGNSGDAETTPPHLHFEIHPVDLLGLGYDGVINPYSYLTAWRRLEDVRFIAGAGWLPSLAEASTAPTPGAFLLSARDISMASGLDPASLQRALEEPVSAEAVTQPRRGRARRREAVGL